MKRAFEEDEGFLVPRNFKGCDEWDCYTYVSYVVIFLIGCGIFDRKICFVFFKYWACNKSILVSFVYIFFVPIKKLIFLLT